MANLVTAASIAKRVTASGLTVIASGVDCVLAGVMANNGAQGTVDLFHGTTTGTSTSIIASGVTLITGVYVPLNVYGSGGIAVLVTGFTTPNITFYWKPI